MSKPPHDQRGARTPATQEQSLSKTQVEIKTQAWSGPLPAPAHLAEYDAIVPGMAARIITMAEKEQGHRIAIETTALDGEISDSKLGKYLGASISFLAVAGAIASMLLDKPWQVSVALVGIPILGIVQALVRSRSE